jgi:hypothetical protein
MYFDVFISYSTPDKPSADATCAALERAGVRCWIAPRDIAPGSDWAASILEAIDQCRLMVLVFTAKANESQQIRNEVVRAVNKGVPIVPLRIESVEPTKALAYFMGAVHWLDALSPPLEQHLDRLTETVKALLELDSGRSSGSSGRPPVSPAVATTARRTNRSRWIAVAAVILLLAGAAAYGYVRYAEYQQSRIDEARDGLYSGPICYGPTRDDPARCFTRSGLLRQGKFSGKWPAREPNATMRVTGEVSASGAARMELIIEDENGVRLTAIFLAGNLQDGRLNATGAFEAGRRVELNWRRN